MKIFLIDNYDSFTYNLLQYIEELGAEVQVARNDKISINDIIKIAPDKIVISPGPCTPKEAGISVDVVREFNGKIPLLGVCLGHQCIGAAFGGTINYAPELMHGKTSDIFHNGQYIFKNIPSPLTATRYHSLIVEKESLPDVLKITAWDDKDVIMGIKHKKSLTFGVQFHPESILTDQGKNILNNFLYKI